jgi:hypothetical protein
LDRPYRRGTFRADGRGLRSSRPRRLPNPIGMSETFHVVPVEDLVGHDEVQDLCVCGPHVEFFPRGKVVVHHALDGRHGGDPAWPRRRALEVARDNSLAEDLLL